MTLTTLSDVFKITMHVPPQDPSADVEYSPMAESYMLIGVGKKYTKLDPGLSDNSVVLIKFAA